MSSNRLIYLILLSLGIIAGILYLSQNSGTLSKELKDFAIEDTANITKLFLADAKNNSVLLEKQSNGTWLIDKKFKARKDAIENILLTIKRVEVKYPVPESELKTIISQLSSNATKVEIYLNGKNKPEKVYYVGHATQNQFGTYMLLEKSGKKSSVPFVTHIPGFFGYLSTRFFAQPFLWRDREIFTLSPEKIKSITVENTEEPETSFTIQQTSAQQFKLLNHKKIALSQFDTASVYNYLNRFSAIYFEQIAAEIETTKKDSILSSTPFHIFTLTDTDNKVKIVKTFHMPNHKGTVDHEGHLFPWDVDRMFAQIIYPDQSSDFVFVQFATFDKIISEINQFSTASFVEK
ncbi:MAG: DUF4340 domain-containing protein [Bacteroidetes bacterium]|nr:DUF4340 domain-containing protein [Bacteroidota bacterium]MBV6460822.1 hypothetical protein [Flavobacteriales bacterium]WKZ75823.1 MAG: DUF4340 domain-containing protein [Vicingaceae bacterium]NOG95677.1 DUF4340 domain-containing protein [Bacteroidota bacterium]CAG0969935.1 hypothetical protein FLAV_01169 [Flavobacteriales bacterium]